MRFDIEQRFSSGPDEVAAAYADPALYPTLAGLPKLGTPEVLDHRVDGDVVHLDVRYRFTGDLSSAARAVLDPSKLTWVDRSVHDLGRRSVSYDLLPDNYEDRFSSQGSYRFEPDGQGCVRRGAGEVRVRARLVAGAVERAIVSGLREHLAGEVGLVERFVNDR